MVKRSAIFAATFFISAAGLALYAFMGVFGRMFTDDYCYSYSYQALGLIGTLRGYYFITTFTAHRYALTFFEWVIDRFGLAGIQWMPLVFLLLWGAAIFYLLREISRRTGRNLKTVELAALSALLLFFTLYLAPNLYQSLYWRTGILPYTTPLVAGLWLLFYLLRRQASDSPVKYALLGLGGFLSAGFSEAGAVFIGALFGLILVWSLWRLVRRDNNAWRGLGRPALTVVAAILIALVVMYLSPVNTQRQASYQPPASVADTFTGAFRFALDFIWLSFRTQPIPNAVFCLMAAGLVLLSDGERTWNPRRLIQLAAATMLTVTIVIWVIHLPSAYVEKAPPADRTLILARFSLLAGKLIIAWIAASLLASLPRKIWMSAAALALVAAGWVYMLRAGVQIVMNEVPRQQKVAQVWDERDGQIRLARQEGQQIIEVRPIDSAYVGGLLELYPSPNWINICAAQYYGVKEILASLPW